MFTLASEGLDEDLHTTAKTKDKMQSRFLLNIIIGKSPSIFELFPGKDQTLLIRRNSFFLLDFTLDIIDCI